MTKTTITLPGILGQLQVECNRINAMNSGALVGTRVKAGKFQVIEWDRINDPVPLSEFMTCSQALEKLQTIAEATQ